jgi:hypothetical protein
LKKYVLLAFLIFLISFNVAGANPYLGVVEGYVSYINNTKVSGANVTVTVHDCSDGCDGNGQTDDNGYYVIGNLNIPANGVVDVYAVLGEFHGSGTFTADEYGTVEANLTLHTTPGLPTLNVTIPDTHGNEVNIYCSPGEDNNEGETPWVEVFLDGNSLGTSHEFNETVSVSYGSHEVKCRTCDSYECSGFVTDTFSLENNPPTAPVLNDFNSLDKRSVVLRWRSGVDSDGDITHDDLIFDGTIYNNVSSPFHVNGLDYFKSYSWGVRTCDDKGACSDWTTSEFVTYYCPPTSGGAGGEECEHWYTSCVNRAMLPVIIDYPRFVNEGDNITICIYYNQTVFSDLKIYVVSLNASDKYITNHSSISNNLREIKLIFNNSGTGSHLFNLTIKGEYTTFNKLINVTTVRTKEIVKTKFVPVEVINFPLILLAVVVTIISILLAMKFRKKD